MLNNNEALVCDRQRSKHDFRSLYFSIRRVSTTNEWGEMSWFYLRLISCFAIKVSFLLKRVGQEMEMLQIGHATNLYTNRAHSGTVIEQGSLMMICNHSPPFAPSLHVRSDKLPRSSQDYLRRVNLIHPPALVSLLSPSLTAASVRCGSSVVTPLLL